MAKKIISADCPNCTNNLKFEEGSKQVICEYCKSTLLIDDDNEYILNTINGAKSSVKVEKANNVFINVTESERKIVDDSIKKSVTKGDTTGQGNKDKSQSPGEKKIHVDDIDNRSIHKNAKEEDFFRKIVLIGLGVSFFLLLVGVITGKFLPIFISMFQIIGVVISSMVSTNVINTPKRNVRYLLLVGALLLTIPNIGCYIRHSEQTSESTNGEQDTDEAIQETNYTIKEGNKYSYKSDAKNVYIATADSGSIITITHWKKDINGTNEMSFSDTIGSFKINDAESGFSWLDNERTAFTVNFQDNNNQLKEVCSHVFTINVNKSNTNKGTDYNDQIACYTFTNDDLHLYRAISLSEHLMKIESWTRNSTNDDFIYNCDCCVVNTYNSDTEFEWTDENKKSFSITMKESYNGSNWKEDILAVFRLENENYEYLNALMYISNQGTGVEEVETPKSSYEYENKDFSSVQAELSDAGFTNIKTEKVYDIVLGITKEGSVKSISIDGNTSFEKGDTYRNDVEVIITYHLKEEDAPSESKETTENSETETTENSDTETIDNSETNSSEVLQAEDVDGQ